MPELPEVEHYRQLLLPLVSKKGNNAIFEFGPPPLPTKRFPSQETIDLINRGNYTITNILRKGKVICMILERRRYETTTTKATADAKANAKAKVVVTNAGIKQANNDMITGNEATLLISLHMGMTGRISSPNHIPKLESLSDEGISYPPPHTHLIIKSSSSPTNNNEQLQACFSDPRRFGSVFVQKYDGQTNSNNDFDEEFIPVFNELAPDALLATGHSTNHDLIVNKLINLKRSIKAILLDQRDVMSGVGNWVADEVLYRSRLHPDQSFLTESEARKLVLEIQFVLSTAVRCLNDGVDFPEDWLFHRRWRGGGGSTSSIKDFNGKTISFITSSGRSSGRLCFIIERSHDTLLDPCYIYSSVLSRSHSYRSFLAEKGCQKSRCT